MSGDLRLLSVLDALLQTASVSRAARRLGLSTPAVSHALARARERLGDPLLVRSGRAMVLTPHAERLKERVHTLVAEAEQVLAPATPVELSAVDGSFVIRASDYVLSILGLGVDRRVAEEAPGITLRFVPNAPDDADALRDGGADLAVGIYGDLPADLRQRHLLTDRFVCVVRAEHPTIRRRITLARYLKAEHLQVAPRGTPGGYVDDVLAERGLSRRVTRAVPYFNTALSWASQTDLVLTISERIARAQAPRLGLRVLEAPLELRPYALGLLWHPRFDGDAGHRFLRDAFAAAAAGAAGDRHSSARTRIDPTDASAGRRRRRPKLQKTKR